MTIFQRIENIIVGLVQLIFGLSLALFPEDGYWVVLTVLGLAMTIKGIKQLFYYFSMARYMVNGRLILVTGCILLDFGVFSGTLFDVPKIYIILYIIIIHAFAGIIEVLKALEEKRLGAKSWRFQLFRGIFDIALVLISLIFIKKPNTVVIVYGIGVAYSAIFKLISCFRKTTLVYVP